MTSWMTKSLIYSLWSLRLRRSTLETFIIAHSLDPVSQGTRLPVSRRTSTVREHLVWPAGPMPASEQRTTRTPARCRLRCRSPASATGPSLASEEREGIVDGQPSVAVIAK